ncbi:MAG: FGGY-family carbohydrate kinase, partial [Clostridia bacterium]|nr:FGGY-family carbohydrate kinase [Clostridia bacterium]
IDRMILTGGGAKGDIVAQILSDVLEASLVRPDHVEEATSIAAAVIAGVGCGIYEDFDAIHKFLKFGAPVEPDFGKKAIYEKQKKVFDDVYQALVPLYKELG